MKEIRKEIKLNDGKVPVKIVGLSLVNSNLEWYGSTPTAYLFVLLSQSLSELSTCRVSRFLRVDICRLYDCVSQVGGRSWIHLHIPTSIVMEDNEAWHRMPISLSSRTFVRLTKLSGKAIVICDIKYWWLFFHSQFDEERMSMSDYLCFRSPIYRICLSVDRTISASHFSADWRLLSRQ